MEETHIITCLKKKKRLTEYQKIILRLKNILHKSISKLLSRRYFLFVLLIFKR